MVAVPTATAVTLPLASTVALDVSLLSQVTVLYVALSGATVAVSVSLAPTWSVRLSLLSVTEVTGTGLTVTAQVADLPSAVAVMVAVPTATAVTLPLLSTVALEVSLLVQVTVLYVALSGATVAVSVSLAPTWSVRLSLLNVTEVTGTGLTVTVQVADFPPAVAVMVAEPMATAVTFPLESTVALDVLLLVQVTVLSSALSGLTVAVSVSLAPISRVSSVLLRVTEATGTGLTVTLQVALESPAWAVMVAVPLATAVTFPLESTVALDVSLLVQVTVLSVAFSGRTVAVSVSDAPIISTSSVLLRETDITGTMLTVTTQMAAASPALAVMVVMPAATAVTLPSASTVATSGC